MTPVSSRPDFIPLRLEDAPLSADALRALLPGVDAALKTLVGRVLRDRELSAQAENVKVSA